MGVGLSSIGIAHINPPCCPAITRGNIAVAGAAVTQTLAALKASPATTRAKARFFLAIDGESLEVEDLSVWETVVCTYQSKMTLEAVEAKK